MKVNWAGFTLLIVKSILTRKSCYVFYMYVGLFQPGRRKKHFIDKKNAVTFHLVHRSQRDPLQADEDAPQRVLLPAVVRPDEAVST